MKNRKPCKICNRPYRQHIKGKPYCIVHLREMGIWEQPRKRMSKEEKNCISFTQDLCGKKKIDTFIN